MTNTEHLEGRKWINALLAIGAVLLAYIAHAFFSQMGEWFDLEAKIQHFSAVIQALSLVLGLGFFIYLIKKKSSMDYLDEVYSELTKVVWADKDSTVKLSIGIMIGVIITSIVLGLVDFGIGKIFGLLYK